MKYLNNLWAELIGHRAMPKFLNIYEVPAVDKKYFANLHTMVLTIGFPRSGSSLIGYLLTAHPNIVMAHEPPEKDLYKIDDVILLLNYILYIDQMRFKIAKKAQNFGEQSPTPSKRVEKRTFYARNRYVYVPNQYQSHCKSLEAIGIKKSLRATQQLNKTNILEQFKMNIERQKMSLKFIFTVRNPYDMIITNIMNWAGKKSITDKNYLQKMIEDHIQRLARMSADNLALLDRINAQDVFMNRHEDMVSAPTEQLAKLGRFLGIETSEDYLNDCAAVIHEKPRQSRHELDWTEEDKEKVAKMIEQYDFLSHYSWSS